MRILAFDPFHGAAGDMICGALISVGAPHEPVIRAMSSVVGTPVIETVSKCGIAAVKINTRAGHAHRTLEEILDIVRAADAPHEVITRAEKIFFRIADAETMVHGTMTHFHEVGADDAIADVIGSCMALSLVSPDRVIVLPVATGKGLITCSHGTLPVPAPATAAILTRGDLLVMSGDANGEQLTPTGAAILSEICDQATRDLPVGRILRAGYGAGSRDDPHSPNVLRVLSMECQGLLPDTVDILETNVDDVSGEVIGNFLTRAMEEGARDASAIPILMKKGRPGHLIRVISLPNESTRLSELMALELGTLGVRVTSGVHRFIADRAIHSIPVDINGKKEVFPVKFGFNDGGCYVIKPEFSAVETYARLNNIPVRDLAEALKQAGMKALKDGKII